MSDQQPVNDNMRLLEALLFASAEPLTTKTIYERMPEGADVGGLLMKLQEHYKGRGVNLIQMDGNWAFRTADDLGDLLKLQRQVQKKLSRAAMETLAIIAYHQPVTRAEIENIRGVVTHKGTVDMLMELGWIKPGRRRETPGRPLTWVTTPAFLDHFSLEALTDLPGMEDLKASGMLDRRPAIETIPGTKDMFDMPESDSDDEDEDEEEDDDAFEDEEDSDAEFDSEDEEDDDDADDSEELLEDRREIA
ncbi:MAG TPA: SMC-Scp complex subunit ScpB [Rhodospirillaceae bacterium]|nr:SMC-Scp complex subunit ScpB [Rhodospirillaceae bacterium]